MPKLYTDANPNTIAYYIEDIGSGYTQLPKPVTSMQAEYLAIRYGLIEYFIKCGGELDARQGELDIEKLEATGKYEFYNVASPADRTPRPLPPPVVVLCDNQVVVNQLSRQYHIGNEELRKIAQSIWQMTKGVDVKYEWISRKENLAGKMIK